MTSTAPTITIIPASVKTNMPLTSPAYVKKRVSAYARVSTDKDDQQNSFEGQVDHWTSYIQSKPEWEFTGMYSDEAVSGTSTKKRDGFNSMVRDALDGKIDLICTKSVSRFARNTVDSLSTIRKLKACGVEVFFEKEGIWTFDSKGELLLTIMSSLAQEESRSISENVKIGIRYGFQKGKVYMPYKQFLGYKKGEDGKPEIVEKEAEIVRLIYRLYLEGGTQNSIARHLTKAGIPTPSGKTEWSVSTVLSILKNEKYKGDALLQKGITVDFLTKKRVVNDGSDEKSPLIYIQNSHPAIVTAEVYELVQEEMCKRKAVGRRQSAASCFSSKIICGDCGDFYGSKIWHSTSKYRRTIWQCNNKFKKDGVCRTPHLYVPQIQQAFIESFNRMTVDKEQIVAEYNSIIDFLTDTVQLQKDITDLTAECGVVSELISRFVGEHTFTVEKQDEEMARYERLVASYDNLANRLKNAINEKAERAARRETLTRFLAALRERDGIMVEFDEELWNTLIESMTVVSENEMRFRFKDGREICVAM